MSHSFQNLQDFVLNLLNDEAARSAYAADPTGALKDAGLGDLTPQDVQEVIPLVTDALPNETPLGDFAVDVTGVMDSTESFGGSVSASSGLGELGGWGVKTDDGVAVWGGSATDLLGRVAGGVAVDGDGVAVAATTPLGYVDADSNGNHHIIPADPADVVGNLGNTGDTVAATVTHMANSGALSLSNAVDAGGDTLEGLLAGTPAGSLAHGVESVTDMVAADIQDGAGVMAEQAGNLPSSGDVPMTLPQGPGLPELPLLGSLPVGVPSLDALPVDGLPVGALPVGALPLGALPVDGLPVDALPVDGLPVGALPLGALPVDGLPVDSLPVDGLPVGALPLGALPVDGLPVDSLPVDGLPVGALPLGALPVDGLPMDSLPVDGLPMDSLPVDVPAGLPAGLPDAGMVTDVLAHNPVTDAVSASPVGGLVDTAHGVTDHLPVGDVTDDLNLGL